MDFWIGRYGMLKFRGFVSLEMRDKSLSDVREHIANLKSADQATWHIGNPTNKNSRVISAYRLSGVHGNHRLVITLRAAWHTSSLHVTCLIYQRSCIGRLTHQRS